MMVEDQSEVVAFLSRPETYGAEVHRVDRARDARVHHLSCWTRAYKLKRSVRFPYLDYSTAALRRRFCEAEVEVNRRTAPDLYHGVVPVVRTARRQP